MSYCNKIRTKLVLIEHTCTIVSEQLQMYLNKQMHVYFMISLNIMCTHDLPAKIHIFVTVEKIWKQFN